MLGRFFIALASQAVIKRATVPEESRNPYMVYVDEAQEYFDEKIEQMLNQARKYKIGFTLSHQNLGQLGHLKHTVFSSTSVKLVGGISAKDAKEMSGEMKCSPDFLLSMTKSTKSSEVACYLKNVTGTAIPISYDFGLLENREVMSESSFTQLIKNIRTQYCSHISEIDYGSVADVSTNSVEPVEKLEKSFPTGNISPLDKSNESLPVEAKSEPKEKTKAKPTKTQENTVEVESEPVEVAPEGKGGITHRYLQNLVKKIGQERGFYSIIENQVFDGLGSVDVSLDGFDRKIAVEVSVTTASDWETGNITKCFSAGYDYVVIVSSEIEHLKKLEKKISTEFKSQIKKEKLFFFLPEQLIQFLDSIKAKSAETEQTISGYKVKVNFTPSNPKEAHLREEAIAKVLLGK